MLKFVWFYFEMLTCFVISVPALVCHLPFITNTHLKLGVCPLCSCLSAMCIYTSPLSFLPLIYLCYLVCTLFSSVLVFDSILGVFGFMPACCLLLFALFGLLTSG